MEAILVLSASRTRDPLGSGVPKTFGCASGPAVRLVK
jgi:hypothetical protein